jgi:site-specific DNA-methyltransferase (adenine-specific)
MHMTTGAPEYYDKGTANVLAAKRVHASDRQHQTQKPVDLMRQLVRVVTPHGGLVVDPFMGSGSTGVAAVEEGRRFFGIERDPSHYQTAIDRLGQTIPPNTVLDGSKPSNKC